MMASHTVRQDMSGYRQIQTDSDEAEDDYESDNAVPQVQHSEQVHFRNRSSAPSITEVQNPDRFVQNVYAYYRRGGLICILVEDILQLVQFAFVVSFGFYLVECIDYALLFRNSSWIPGNMNINQTWWNELPAELRAWLDRFMNGTGEGLPPRKLNLDDIAEPIGQCVANSSGWARLVFLIALATLLFRTLKFLARLSGHLRMQRFFNEALCYSDSTHLASTTWSEVQHRLIAFCRSGGAAFLGGNVDELQIHQRLLRYRNYLIGLVASETLPIRLQIPFYGTHVYLPDALKWNTEFALFWGPYSPFRNGATLPETYTKRRVFAAQRSELAASLSRQFMLLGLLNFALFPLIAIFQVFNFTFQYAAELRQNPTAIGARRWTNYARLRYRHYNETDEQLDKRLACAYRPASDYLAGFRSRIAIILARSVMFIAGAFLAVLVFLSLIDSDVLLMDHVLVTMTTLTVVVSVCRSLMPDPTVYFNPDYLFFKYASYVDYAPVRAGDRETFARLVREPVTRHRVGEALQYRYVALLEELFSPIVTPLILIFYFAPAADRLVSFLHANTIRVDVLGDVCSGAHFDMRTNRHPLWTASLISSGNNDDQKLPGDDADEANSRRQDEDSVPLHAVENEQAAERMYVSLVHFHERNPTWMPVQAEQSRFLSEKARDETAMSISGSGVLSQEEEEDAFPIGPLPSRHRDPTSPTKQAIGENVLFLTSLCDSMLHDDSIRRGSDTLAFGNPATLGTSQSQARFAPDQMESVTGRPSSIARSIMFVRERYERNRRERNARSVYNRSQVTSNSTIEMNPDPSQLRSVTVGHARVNAPSASRPLQTPASVPGPSSQVKSGVEPETYLSVHSNLASVYHAAHESMLEGEHMGLGLGLGQGLELAPLGTYGNQGQRLDAEDSDNEINLRYDEPPVMQTVGIGRPYYNLDSLLPPIQSVDAEPSASASASRSTAPPTESQTDDKPPV